LKEIKKLTRPDFEKKKINFGNLNVTLMHFDDRRFMSKNWEK